MASRRESVVNCQVRAGAQRPTIRRAEKARLFRASLVRQSRAHRHREFASLQNGRRIQNARPFVILKSVFGMPLRDLIVDVMLDFARRARFPDNLAAAILEDHDIVGFDSEAFVGLDRHGDLAVPGYDERW